MLATREDSELLERVSLFASLDRVGRARLAAYLEPVAVDDGAVVVRQGDTADSLYVVAQGRFGVYTRDAHDHELRVGALEPSDYFGEMALLATMPRSATVRAEGPGEVLRLERDRFEKLVREEPAVALAVARTLSQRLLAADAALAREASALETALRQGLAELEPTLRGHVLEASLLERPSAAALQALYGAEAEAVAAALAALGATAESSASLEALRAQFTAEGGAAVAAHAREIADRLIAARCWDDALALLARQDPAALAAALGQALRDAPPLDEEAASKWVARLPDEHAARDAELALRRAQHHQAHGNARASRALLRQALDAALARGDTSGGERLSAALAALDPGVRAHGGTLEVARRRWGVWLPSTIAAVLTVAAFALARGQPPIAFLLLFAAALVLWTAETLPNAVVALGLTAALLLLDVANARQVLSGFDTANWLFVLSVLGIAAATAQSGLLFRGGLLLVRHLPQGLFWQAATLVATGVLLAPLLPQNQARVALTAPLAQSIADSERLPDHDPRAAVLGMAAWLGAGSLLFWFLNGSSVSLLAWGLLPEAERVRFNLVYWTVAVLPFAVLVTVGALVALFLVLRPSVGARIEAERVDFQIAVLGPPTFREWAMLVVLLGMLVGVVAAPSLGLPTALPPLLGLFVASATGSFDARALRGLDWNFLVYYGVVLSVANLIQALGLGQEAAAVVGGLLGQAGVGGLGLVLLAALLSFLVRLLVPQSQALLILALALFPVAANMGVNPWVVAVALLATNTQWLFPNQTLSYLTAYTTVDGRLWTHAQARRACLAYDAAVLVGLVAAVPYWHLLGLL